MNTIALFFGLALLAVSVFFVASPFRLQGLQKRSARQGAAQKGSPQVSAEKQRQAVLLALRDLDFDYQAAKVAEEDYQSLRANLLAEAAELMQRQESDSIEALIQARRQARLKEPPAANGKTNGKAKSIGPAGGQCHHCQAPLAEGAKFCSKCGAPAAEITCPKCKQSLQPGDSFCPACGTAVHAEKPAAR